MLGTNPAHQAWLDTTGFKPGLGKTALLPGADGRPVLAVAGFGNAAARARGRFPLAAAAATLPQGTYRLATPLPAGDLETETLGWLLAGYRFDRYAKQAPEAAALVCPQGVDATRVEAIANAEALTRDLSIPPPPTWDRTRSKRPVVPRQDLRCRN